jgi:putative methyltransferase (TIGR04325 family)
MTDIEIFSQPTYANLIQSRNNTGVWESARWVSRQKNFLELARQGKFERKSILLENLLSQSVPSTIIDFGGGSGWLYHRLENLNFQIDAYINVESINLHENCVHQVDRYNFIDLNSDLSQLNDFPGTKVLYLNSVVQYLEDDDKLVQLLNDCCPTHLVLEDVTLSEGNEFFALQLYYETKIPYRFVNEHRLISNIERAGMCLSRKISYPRHIADGFTYDFDEANTGFQIGQTVSFEFSAQHATTLIN